jgi:sulfur carrier protein ThiS
MRLISFMIATASLALAGDGPGWQKVPRYPQLEYRLSCLNGQALSVLWRNGYPGAVSLKARVKSDTYDGIEDAKMPPGQTFKSDPDTMYCSLASVRVTVVKFSMAAPAPLPKPTEALSVPKPAPAEPAVPAVVPPAVLFDSHAEKLPEISPERLTRISTGMTREDVLAKLGPPASRLSTESDGEYVETLQYRLGGDRIGVVRLSNGIVTEIARPQ